VPQVSSASVAHERLKGLLGLLIDSCQVVNDVRGTLDRALQLYKGQRARIAIDWSEKDELPLNGLTGENLDPFFVLFLRPLKLRYQLAVLSINVKDHVKISDVCARPRSSAWPFSLAGC
jgi:hypothetical protein